MGQGILTTQSEKEEGSWYQIFLLPCVKTSIFYPYPLQQQEELASSGVPI